MTKVEGQEMGIAICPNLRFRVHPYCQTRGGGLLQLSREDRQALKDCKVKNNLVTKLQQFKRKAFKGKSKRKKARKKKNRKSMQKFKNGRMKRKRKSKFRGKLKV